VRWLCACVPQHLVEPHLPIAIDFVGVLLAVQAENRV
jgi:hypothetical protein